MTIHVSDTDISKGIRGRCGSCPVALALNRKLEELGYRTPDYGYSAYAGSYIVFYKFGFSRVSRLDVPPIAAWSFMADFDKGFPVRPFTFDIPDSWMDSLTRLL